MTKLAEKVMSTLQHLPDAEQDEAARYFLYLLEEDRRWENTSRDGGDGLDRRGDAAPDELDAGLADDLELDKQ